MAIVPDQVVIISDFSSVQGGASKLAVLQAELLVARGIKVTFFCGDEGHALPNGVSSVALGGARLLEGNKLSSAVNGLWNKTAQRVLAGWVAAHDTAATIYHVHGYHQTLSPAVLAPLKHVRSRVVMHAHDYFLACPNGAFFDYRSETTCTRRPMSGACIGRNCDKRSYAQKLWRTSRQALQNTARKRLCPDVTTILIHEGMSQYLFRDGVDARMAVVPNPAVALSAEPIDASRNKDILYVGDIHHYKGVELLARAGKQAGVCIRFVGKGQDFDSLRQAYPGHHFDGWQDKAGLQRLLADARLLVSPTLGPEPFGLAPTEALLSGVPVILSDSMLLAPQIVAHDMGRTFAAGDCDMLATLLARLDGDDGLVKTMSQNAVQHARQLSLDVDSWADALLTVYSDVLAPTSQTGG